MMKWLKKYFGVRSEEAYQWQKETADFWQDKAQRLEATRCGIPESKIDEYVIKEDGSEMGLFCTNCHKHKSLPRVGNYTECYFCGSTRTDAEVLAYGGHK